MKGANSHKLARNIPLLETYVGQDPERVYCWWHLGDMLQLRETRTAPRKLGQGGIEVARGQIIGRSDQQRPALLLGLSLLRMPGLPADDLIEEALSARSPQHLFLRWLACQLALERGEVRPAHGHRGARSDRPGHFPRRGGFLRQDTVFLCLPRKLGSLSFPCRPLPEAAHWYRLAAVAAPDPRACEVKAQLARPGPPGCCSLIKFGAVTSEPAFASGYGGHQEPIWLSAAVPTLPCSRSEWQVSGD